MALQEVRFLMRIDREAGHDGLVQLFDEANVLFVGDGCGYTMEDEFATPTQVRIWAKTDSAIIDAYLADPRVTLIEMKLVCSECGAEWWGLPDGSGMCAECVAQGEVE